MSARIFVINPGSSTTKVALYEGLAPVFAEEVAHDKGGLAAYGRVVEQLGLRRVAVQAAIEKHAAAFGANVDAVVGRGGLLRPIPGGIYAISKDMLEDLTAARYGEHACNLGAILAAEWAQAWGVPAFVVDPVVTDELRAVARVTGLPSVARRSVFHALSQRAAAREAATRAGVRYEEGKFLVAHLGGGISIGAHDRGRVVDVVNALDGEGPLSPERTGRLPLIPVLRMIEEGAATPAELRRTILSQGGLYAHLASTDFRQVEAWAEDIGHEKQPLAELLIRALAYNVAKELAGLAPALMEEDGGPVTAIVLTGGLARSSRLVQEITRRVVFLAPVAVVADAEEMRALAAGGIRALSVEGEVREYVGEGRGATAPCPGVKYD